ncbi:calcium-dependent protein kinase 4-like protein [Corchorus olitorius]|uniref:Calcium-dependent protein kinase 4-like protein n=1 Tax=Corchorus olitorius TaxID=93759 RepID=A0A1R3L4M8_9ROSI|nr:calcium-dependent protein kinase 4-like protein [Corchorus olitorius]
MVAGCSTNRRTKSDSPMTPVSMKVDKEAFGQVNRGLVIAESLSEEKVTGLKEIFEEEYAFSIKLMVLFLQPVLLMFSIWVLHVFVEMSMRKLYEDLKMWKETITKGANFFLKYASTQGIARMRTFKIKAIQVSYYFFVFGAQILIDGRGVNAIDFERKPLPTLANFEETSTPP